MPSVLLFYLQLFLSVTSLPCVLSLPVMHVVYCGSCSHCFVTYYTTSNIDFSFLHQCFGFTVGYHYQKLRFCPSLTFTHERIKQRLVSIGFHYSEHYYYHYYYYFFIPVIGCWYESSLVSPGFYSYVGISFLFMSSPKKCYPI